MQLKSNQHIPIRHSIATKLLKVVFSFYLVIAVCVTVGHMVMEYQYQKASIRQSLVDIQGSFDQHLSIDMWNINRESLRSTVQGMVKIPEVVGVRIQNASGACTAFGCMFSSKDDSGDILVDVNPLGLTQEAEAFHTKMLSTADIFEHQFPIIYTYKGEAKKIGEATIYSSTKVVFQRVKLGFFLLVVNAVLKTVALWLIFLWFSNYLLRKPLTSLANDTEKVSMENLDSFRVSVETSGRNELKVLEESFNLMIDNLHQSKVEQDNSAKALLVSEKRLRTLVANIPGVSYSCAPDEDWTMELISDGIKELSGYPAADFIGNRIRSFASIMHSEDLPKVIDIVAESIEQKKPYILEYRIIHANGEVRWVFEKGQGVFDDEGQQVSFDGVIVDITKLKESEIETAKLESRLQQSQKMEAVGTLAGGIAHDFNNILAAIIGYAELAQLQMAEGSQVWLHQQEVIKASIRAKELVTQILSFSRQGGNDLKPLQVHLVIKEALKLLRASIPTTIEIRDCIDTNSGTVLADPTQIHQIMMNLCTNAYHAMRESGGVLGVELSQVEVTKKESKVSALHLAPGSYLLLKVSDSGHGMDRATKDKIFDPYFTTKKTGEGTGLGLAVVHGIVKSYGGYTSVYSEPGKGTCFQIYLPQIATNAVEEEVDGYADIPLGNEKILLVDDDEAILLMEQGILEQLGYRVTTMLSSESALQVFSSQPDNFDLVVTDMTMPDMTGAVLSQKILAIRPDMPIIMCTGFSELINEDKAKAIGIREYVIKPIVRKDMAKVVRKVLDAPC